MLFCRIHNCPSSCHQLFDHSKIKCKVVLKQKCTNGHTQSWQCHQGASAPVACGKCQRERKEAERKAQKALEDQLRRDAADDKHRQESAKIQDEIERVAQEMKDINLDMERQAALNQLRIDLEAKKESANRVKLKQSTKKDTDLGTQNPDLTAYADSSQPRPSSPSCPPNKTVNRTGKLQEHIKICLDRNNSQAKTDWQRQIDQEEVGEGMVLETRGR
jgi:hypothetical protein